MASKANNTNNRFIKGPLNAGVRARRLAGLTRP
jgi:hypothetical protein